VTHAAITYRLARAEDAETTFAIVRAASDDLARKAGREPGPHALPVERVIRFRHACLAHDPARFVVAEVDGSLVGAAIAILRGAVWYLAGLHVLPGFQAAGVGSELMRRALAGTASTTIRTVLTDATNPASNGLYLRAGMLPLDSTLTFDGPLRPTAGPGSSSGPTAALGSRPIDPERDTDALARLDRSTVGFTRPTDHTFWRGVPGLEARLVTRPDGEPSGYLYVSRAGAIGPIAVADPTDLPAVLDLAATIATDAGASALHLRVFGATHGAIDWANDRGLRLTGIGLFLASARVGAYAGYITSGADALY
jgi:predicted N-acetyltransferase YhbS